MPARALLLTHSGDYFTIDRVAAALKRRGVAALRVDTDKPWGLTAELPARLVLHHGTREHDLGAVRAVWARRRWFRGLEWQQPFEALARARWVNPPAAEDAAESKLLQLRVAARLGFRVPPTLITDRPSAVRAFQRRHGRVITKLLYPRVQSMDAHPDFVYTREVTAVGRLERPQIFQPLLEKVREVRLIAVGRHVLAGSIDSRASPTGWLDWRLSQPSDGTDWVVETVPHEVARRVKKMLRTLKLAYGAFDFLIMPKNRWVFLEVNPAGEYGWLERDLGLPISSAIADALS